MSIKGEVRKWILTNPFVVFLSLQIFVILLLSSNNKTLSFISRTDVDWVGKEAVYTVQITHFPQEKKNTFLLDARVLSVADSVSVEECKGNIRLYLQKDSAAGSLLQGDIIAVACRPYLPRKSAGEFDYGKYLIYNGISAQAYSDSLSWQKISHSTLLSPVAIAERVRMALAGNYNNSNISRRNASIISALTLGDRSCLDADTRDVFVNAGAMHILAVSGLHVGIIYSLVWMLLTGFGLWIPSFKNRSGRFGLYFSLILLLWCYAFITGLSASVVRATLMATMFTVSMMLERKSSHFNTLAASAFLLLLFRPLDLFNLSFLLSYSAVLSILTIGIWLSGSLIKIRNKVLKYFYDIFAISIAAQAGVLPWTLLFFGTTSNYFLLTNMMVIPLAPVLVYASLFVLLSAPIPTIAFYASVAVNWFTDIFYGAIHFVNTLPGAISFCRFTPLMAVVLAFAIVMAYLFLKRQQWGYICVCAVFLALLSGLYYQNEHRLSARDELIIGNYVVHKQGEVVDTLSRDDTISFFRYNGSSYLYLSAEALHFKVAEEPVECDNLIVDRVGRTSVEEVSQIIKADTIILTARVSRYKTAAFRQWCDSNNITLIDTHNADYIIKNN